MPGNNEKGEEMDMAELAAINSGEGWYEWVTPGISLMRLAYVYESGNVYFPEGDDMDESDFLIAAAQGDAHRLIRADEPRS